MGDMVHQTLQHLYVILELKIPELKEVLEFYNEIWNKNYTQDILIAKPDKTKEDYRKDGERFIIAFYYKNQPFKQSKTLDLETQMFFPLDSNRNYHIRIDRLAKSNNTIEIHDYKTSNRLKTQEELDNDRQLAMYSLWVKQQYPNLKIKLIWHFLAFNQKLISERTEAQLEELKKEVLRDIEKIESTTDFPANLGPLCNYCLFQNLCPEFKSTSQ